MTSLMMLGKYAPPYSMLSIGSDKLMMRQG
jgi:hypothetical protein